MIRKFFTVIFLLFLSAVSQSQPAVKTSDLFTREETGTNLGRLVITQPLQLDTLISRHILANKNLYPVNNHYGMEGFRIQIYSSNNRNARDESNKTRAEFMSKFPEIVSYPLYAEPGYFKVRVGDYRTKTEAFRVYKQISNEFPEAYIVPDVINFPDLNNK